MEFFVSQYFCMNCFLTLDINLTKYLFTKPIGFAYDNEIQLNLQIVFPLIVVQATAVAADQNGSTGFERLVQSTPGSPQDRRPNSFEVIGSAESLVGRVSHSLRYCCLKSKF